VQWKVFEMDRTNIFDRIITTIGEKIEPPKGGDVSNVTLCYWLSNTVTLLLLLQKNLKPAAMPGGARRLTAGSVSPASASSSKPCCRAF
jgi:myosin-5